MAGERCSGPVTVFPQAEPGGDTLEDELRDRPAPPFRTPHPDRG
ncbi:hypothetical protein [Actinomycetospora straminea]|nr:hypothetical protein [Actinomycetospora straminea]MDD7935768.1 hypothetical protein [Actinomycetospora straminea]